jgi:hypothetical protein
MDQNTVKQLKLQLKEEHELYLRCIDLFANPLHIEGLETDFIEYDGRGLESQIKRINALDAILKREYLRRFPETPYQISDHGHIYFSEEDHVHYMLAL